MKTIKSLIHLPRFKNISEQIRRPKTAAFVCSFEKYKKQQLVVSSSQYTLK